MDQTKPYLLASFFFFVSPAKVPDSWGKLGHVTGSSPISRLIKSGGAGLDCVSGRKRRWGVRPLARSTGFLPAGNCHFKWWSSGAGRHVTVVGSGVTARPLPHCHVITDKHRDKHSPYLFNNWPGEWSSGLRRCLDAQSVSVIESLRVVFIILRVLAMAAKRYWPEQGLADVYFIPQE